MNARKTRREITSEYDSYVHLDVKDKWVVVFRYMPEDITPERRQQSIPRVAVAFQGDRRPQTAERRG